MKELGVLHYFHNLVGILLSHRHYVLNMLYKFGITNCPSVSTPLDKNLKLYPDFGGACDEKWFQKIVKTLYI